MPAQYHLLIVEYFCTEMFHICDIFFSSAKNFAQNLWKDWDLAGHAAFWGMKKHISGVIESWGQLPEKCNQQDLLAEIP